MQSHATSVKISELFLTESKPLPPPKPQRPSILQKEEPIPEEKPKMERAKSFVNVHKTSLKSDRILPNDDLVLNQARRQKSFAGPSAKRIAQLKNPGEKHLQRASSMGNLGDKKEEIVRVRSLVEVDDYDGKCKIMCHWEIYQNLC